MRRSLFICLLVTAYGLYEEPPGGCQAPPDDFEPPIAQPRARSAARTVPAPAKPPPPPLDPEAEHEQLERELYERESASQLSGLGADEEDWEAIEKAHVRALRKRQTLSSLVIILGACFAAYKVVQHVMALRQAPNADGAKKQAATAKTPDAADAPEASAGPSKKASAKAGAAADKAKPKADGKAAAPATSVTAADIDNMDENEKLKFVEGFEEVD